MCHPLWPASRAQGHCNCHLMTRRLSSWRRGSVWGRPDRPYEGMSQPCRPWRTSACFRDVCAPSTGSLQKQVNRHPDNLMWGHAGSIFSGPGHHRQKSKPLWPLIALLGRSSSQSQRRCWPHGQAWRAIPWSYSSLPRSGVTRRYGGRSIGGGDPGFVSSGPMPKPFVSPKVSRWFGVELRQWRRSLHTSSVTPRLVGIDGIAYRGEVPPLPSTAPLTSCTSFGGGGGGDWPRLWSMLWVTLTVHVGELELPWPIGDLATAGGLVVLLADFWGDAMYTSSEREAKGGLAVPVPVL